MRRPKPFVGLSLMLEDDFRKATLPLFEKSSVDVLEWSFDMAWEGSLPRWARELLEIYSRNNRLLGHGVSFSVLSGEWTARHDRWLKLFSQECTTRQYLHISEHFGFMSAGRFSRSAPLPVPRGDAVVRLGVERLKRLADISGRPVGLENLAFAFSDRDVDEQGPFLAELLAPVDGFLVLDLHNLFCQMHNFGRSADDLLSRYPTDRVREIHVSGGSWSTAHSGIWTSRIRRDTHDAAIPQEVFDIVPLALARCPNIHSVIFERLGGSISTEMEAAEIRDDFERLRTLVANGTDAKR